MFQHPALFQITSASSKRLEHRKLRFHLYLCLCSHQTADVLICIRIIQMHLSMFCRHNIWLEWMHGFQIKFISSDHFPFDLTYPYIKPLLYVPTSKSPCDFISAPLCVTLKYRPPPLLLWNSHLAGMLHHPELGTAFSHGKNKEESLVSSGRICRCLQICVRLLRPGRTCPSNVLMLNIYQKWV